MAAPKVFVSYSRHDRDITQRLVADLTKAGAEVWVDVDGIQFGNFMQIIDKALAQCDWSVLVLSPSAIASEYVPEETYTALHRVKQGYMKGVIPVLVAACQPGSIPPQWDVLQRYDATQEYEAALGGVLRALGLPSSAGQTSVEFPPPRPRERFAVQSVDRFPSIRRFRQAEKPGHQEQLGIHPSRADLVPAHLVELGFTAHSNKGAEYLLSPFCAVPKGPFLMGSNPKSLLMGSNPRRGRNAAKDERPQHTVTLPAYDIARFPVTVAEYACFVRSSHTRPNDSEEPNDWQEATTGTMYGLLDLAEDRTWKDQLNRLDYPVVRVTWRNAVAYAVWLSEHTGENWRLPTEAEWEKAARGTTGLTYPCGDTFDKTRCHTAEIGGRAIISTDRTAVGYYPSGASPYGIQDMVGNVWEWTASLHLPYPYTTSGEREDPNSIDDRVVRGGYFFGDEEAVSASFRSRCQPDRFMNNIGFRLVRAAPNS